MILTPNLLFEYTKSTGIVGKAPSTLHRLDYCYIENALIHNEWGHFFWGELSISLASYYFVLVLSELDVFVELEALLSELELLDEEVSEFFDSLVSFEDELSESFDSLVSFEDELLESEDDEELLSVESLVLSLSGPVESGVSPVS